MNQHIAGILEQLKAQPAAPLWLIAPSLRIGNSWAQQAAMAGGWAVNLSILTPTGFLLKLLGGREITLADPLQREVLLRGIFRRLAKDVQNPYLFSLQADTALIRLLRGTIDDLRSSGVTPETLASDGGAKHRELADLLAGYQQTMKERGWSDAADLASQAAPQAETFAKAKVLIFEDVLTDLPHCQQAVFKALPSAHLAVLPADSADAAFAGCDAIDFYQALGAANEVREVFRRVLAAQIPLDQVELIYADRATYLPLVYEQTQRLAAEVDGLATTFADGVPAGYSRPGRLLAAWLDWVREDCPQAALLEMVREGLLDWPDRNGLGFHRAAEALASLPVRIGREHYEGAVSYWLEAEQYQNAVESTNEDAETPASSSATDRPSLASVVRRLLALTPDVNGSAEAAIAAALGLLGDMGRRVDELDGLAHQALCEKLNALRKLMNAEPTWSAGDGLNLIADMLGELRIGGSGARPGRLHAAPLSAGGQTGREHTFILGLNDHNFPPGGLQDPLLLDAERGRLNAQLPTAAKRLDDATARFARLLARLRGRLTLSFCFSDIISGAAPAPSPAVVEAWRHVAGRPDAAQEDMLAAVPRVDFTPTSPDKQTNLTEAWLQTLLDDPAVAQNPPINLHDHPADWIGGVLPAAGDIRNPFADNGPALSASSLETYGACGLRYFFQKVLGLSPPPEYQTEQEAWLDPMQVGSLLHAVFCGFLRDLTSRDALPPDVERDGDLMRELLGRQADAYRCAVPPPSEAAYQQQRRQLEQACDIFLHAQAAFCRTSRPVWLEAALGMASDEQGATDLDTREPIPLGLDSGVIRLRGRLDRIDQTDDGWSIWDYKTGSSRKYRDPKEPDGPIFQPFLYMEMLKRRFEEAGVAGPVTLAGYLFCSWREFGWRLGFSPEQLESKRSELDVLCRAMAAGEFLPTDKISRCQWCDYKTICGTEEETKALGDALRERLKGGEA